MTLLYNQLIEMSLSQACAGLDPLTAPISDTSWIAEDLVASIFQQVGAACARDEHKRSLLRKPKTISFVNGSATVTADVLTEYKEDSTLYDPTDLTKEYSLVREWGDFVQPRTSYALWLGTYSINGATIGVVEANANYSSTTGLNGDRTLVIPCAPMIPASAATAIDVVPELENELVEALAVALRGAINDPSAKAAT